MLEEFFWSIVILITTLVEWTIFDFILKEISEQKVSKNIKNIFLTSAIFYVVFCNLVVVDINFKLFSAIGVSIVYYLCTYDVKRGKAIVIVLLFWMLLLVGDLIGSSIVPIIHKLDNMEELLSNNSFRLQLIIISKSILFLSIPIFKGIKLIKDLSYREILWMIVPVIGNIFSMIIVGGYALTNANNNMTEYFLIFSLSIVLLCSNISLIFIISNSIKTTKIKIENKVIKENLELQLLHYTQQREVENRIRRMYHDINNHVVCLDSIYGKNQEAKKYIDAIKNEIKDYSKHFKTQNPILDAILYQKSIICEKENIKFDATINFSKCNFMDNIDVCTIFSNLLDNSIEANERITDSDRKYIRLKGVVVNNFYIIKCENSKRNDILIENDEVITTKKDKLIHGIGIKNIQDTIIKYEGEFSIKHDKKTFIITILIPLF